MNLPNAKQDSAPVALFVYNRPEHTRRTIEALAKNDGAKNTVLYIFADAARSNADVASVHSVREYIRKIEGFQQIVITEQAINQGLAKSIIAGVTDIVNQHGKIIVLEDDIVTSKYFLKYMNDALKQYEDVQHVMHISGCSYPVGELSLAEQQTYLLRVPLCWGWATWASEWRLFQRNLTIMNKFTPRMIRDIDFDNTYDYWRQMELNHNGKITTWFIFWYATLYLNKGLALFPRNSLVNNIGHDGSGVHCGSSDDYNVQLRLSPVEVQCIPLIESSIAFEAHKSYFRSVRISLLQRIVRKLQKLLKK